jgi:hypothetical protein
MKDRKLIFNTLLPEETYVDRRIEKIEDIEEESEDAFSEGEQSEFKRRAFGTKDSGFGTMNNSDHLSEIARTYVGELITRVENNYGLVQFIV